MMDMKKDNINVVKKKRSKTKNKRMVKSKSMNNLKNNELMQNMEVIPQKQNVNVDKMEENVHREIVNTKKAKKRKKSDVMIKNCSLTASTSSKRNRTFSVLDDLTIDVDGIEEKMCDVEMTKQPFSVDMSKICTGRHRAIVPVSVVDIQRLLLFSLLGSSHSSLPGWATLDQTSVKQVVVVLVKYVSSKLFEVNEKCFPKLGAMFDVVFPFDNSGYLLHIKSPQHSLLTITTKQKKKKKEANEVPTEPVARNNYVLNETQLIKNEFLIPGLSKEALDFFTIPKSSEIPVTNSSSMFALDCEMCMSAKGRELTRISVVNESHDVVYDVLVKPKEPITNYLTRFSGITEETLRDVKTTLEDVQQKLKDIISPDAIIVGHSLEFDFTALKFFHNKVIDTSVIYDDGRGVGFKPGLKYLAKKYLKAHIQSDFNGHCSIEDARSSMKLAQLKIEKGPTFGKKDFETEKNFLDYISENSPKKGVIVDRPSNAKQYSGSNDALPCVDDEEVVSKVIKGLSKYHFIWSQLHNIDTMNSEKRNGHDETIKPLLQQIDTNISQIHDSLGSGTLFVVLLGAADTSLIRRLRTDGTSGKKLKNADKEAKRGLCFIKLVNKSQECSNT